jgi:hypothetical protein
MAAGGRDGVGDSDDDGALGESLSFLSYHEWTAARNDKGEGPWPGRELCGDCGCKVAAHAECRRLRGRSG